MVTQHPDHANVPYWHTEAFISAAQEPRECFLSFSELGATEYKWDWEGKLVDESIVERLLTEHLDYFQKNPLGTEKFLTFRLPNPKVETEYRLGRAFMGMISASSLARHAGYEHNPLFEVILPMTETAAEMISVQEAFAEISSLKHPLLKQDSSTLKHIELIPLFEQIDIIADAANILEEYFAGHKKKFGFAPPYLRPYLARSDPALNAGVIATVLSIKLALSRFRTFEKKFEVPLYPIIGAAALPFRGGLTPNRIEEFIDEYRGIRTTTIQSGFKYDYPQEVVINAIKRLADRLPLHSAEQIPAADETQIITIMKLFEKLYQEVIADIAGLVNEVAAFIPKRRERVQHVGLFGYSRGVGNVKLPRAIGFTAAMYSLGVPPELISSGRGLSLATKQGGLPLIEKYYVHLKEDMMRSGAYLNKNNLERLARKSPGWKLIVEDVSGLETYLKTELGPRTKDEVRHQEITSDILLRLESGTLSAELLLEAALLRKSIG